MRLILGLIFAAALSAPALACSCMRGANAPQPPYVVEARVVTVRAEGARIRADLVVIRAEKGRTGRQITLTTPSQSAACGVSFRPGEVRRIGFSRDRDGGYAADLCQQLAISRRGR